MTKHTAALVAATTVATLFFLVLDRSKSKFRGSGIGWGSADESGGTASTHEDADASKVGVVQMTSDQTDSVWEPYVPSTSFLALMPRQTDALSTTTVAATTLSVSREDIRAPLEAPLHGLHGLSEAEEGSTPANVAGDDDSPHYEVRASTTLVTEEGKEAYDDDAEEAPAKVPEVQTISTTAAARTSTASKVSDFVDGHGRRADDGIAQRSAPILSGS